jgi:hypothetical protein
MRRSAHRLALTGVDSQITEALLQAFSASELYPTSDGFGRIRCRSRVGRSAVFAMVTTANKDYTGVAMQGPAESAAGSGRAITRLPALARFPPRPLLLDLADQVSSHLREGMIKVALVRSRHQVRPSRKPGLKGDLLVRALGIFQ